MKNQDMTFHGMSAADALEKAHAEFPEVQWEWMCASVGRPGYECCGCAVALLAHAMGLSMFWRNTEAEKAVWGAVGAQFPHIVPVNPRFDRHPEGYQRAVHISDATSGSRSFEDAVRILRERGI